MRKSMPKTLVRARYFVYTHSIGGVVFYVGSSYMRVKRGGALRTWHERAYTKSKREPEWYAFVCGREITVDIIGYYETKEAVLDTEYTLIHELRDKPYAQLVNKLGTRPVFQFSLIGEFIKEWKSVSDAAKSLGINRHSISCCLHELNPQRTQAGGFLWSHEKLPPKYLKGTILQKTLEGELINAFPTIREATNHLGVNSYTVIKGVISGKYKHGYGYKWERV